MEDHQIEKFQLKETTVFKAFSHNQLSERVLPPFSLSKNSYIFFIGDSVPVLVSGLRLEILLSFSYCNDMLLTVHLFCNAGKGRTQRAGNFYNAAKAFESLSQAAACR